MSKVLFVRVKSDDIDYVDSGDEPVGEQVARLINEVVAEENITSITPCWNPFGDRQNVIGYLVAVDE